MKFHFSYQSLLGHRKLLEEIAQRDYVEAQTVLDQQKEIYKHLYTRLHEVEGESSDLRSQSGSIAMLTELDEFMAGQKIKISRQREVVINHTQIVEGKQEILIAAAKETKILEKLREKQMATFKKAMQKKEMKRTDEIVVTRFRAGGKT